MNYKLLIAGVALITLGTLLLTNQKTSYQTNQKEFQEFIKTHNKTYTSKNSQNYRYSIYLQNKSLIQEHNKTNSSYTLKINKFADLTWEEFQSNYLSKLKDDDKSKCEKDPSFFKKTHKEHMDWQTAGVVQKVKDQGQCGSCWAFSTIGALESALAIKAGTKDQVPNLSEQELVDCSTSYGNLGCNGGLMGFGYDYILDHHVNTEEAYPYVGRDMTCRTDSVGEGETGISRCVRVPPNTDGLTDALSDQPVAVAFYVNLGFQFYFGGIFDPWFCNGQPNHAVLAVGFEANVSKPFYKIKNSWGAGWGEQGYFRMAIGKKAAGTCNIAGHGMNFVPVV